MLHRSRGLNCLFWDMPFRTDFEESIRNSYRDTKIFIIIKVVDLDKASKFDLKIYFQLLGTANRHHIVSGFKIEPQHFWCSVNRECTVINVSIQHSKRVKVINFHLQHVCAEYNAYICIYKAIFHWIYIVIFLPFTQPKQSLLLSLCSRFFWVNYLFVLLIKKKMVYITAYSSHTVFNAQFKLTENLPSCQTKTIWEEKKQRCVTEG